MLIFFFYKQVLRFNLPFLPTPFALPPFRVPLSIAFLNLCFPYLSLAATMPPIVLCNAGKWLMGPFPSLAALSLMVLTTIPLKQYHSLC